MSAVMVDAPETAVRPSPAAFWDAGPSLPKRGEENKLDSNIILFFVPPISQWAGKRPVVN